MSGYSSDSSTSTKDSLESIAKYDTEERKDLGENQEYITNVRDSVKNWKVRELDKNTENETNVKGLDPLRRYVANSSRLFYDLTNFLTTSQNTESNMKDSLYVKIISAIGNPGSLSFHLRSLVEHFLQRDLVELPFTLEPKITNSYAQKGVQVERNFPEEE
jgi:hypothetical protein